MATSWFVSLKCFFSGISCQNWSIRVLWRHWWRKLQLLLLAVAIFPKFIYETEITMSHCVVTQWLFIDIESHFALNTVFRVESLSNDAPVLRPDCFKIDVDAYNTVRVSGKDVAHSLRFLEINLMSIFVGVRCWGGVKCECGRQKCEFSLSMAISSVWSSPLVLHTEIIHGFARFPGDSTALDIKSHDG